MRWLIPILFALLACHPPGQHPEKPWDQQPASEASSQFDLSLSSIPRERVQQAEWDFWVIRRTPEMRHWPCQPCHPTGKGPTQEEPLAHWDIGLKHASADVMSCATCHDKQGDMAQLHSLQGAKIPMDQAFQVCAQCHSSQAQDWLGGAHGKRLARWDGPALRYSCTQCHNPHQPAWDQRWPQITAPHLSE